MSFRYRKIMVLVCLCLLLSLLNIMAVSAEEGFEATKQTEPPMVEVPDQTEATEPVISEATQTPEIEGPEQIAVTDIVVSDYDDVLEVDSTLHLSTTVLPNTATDQTVQYSSSAPNVATVSQTGEVKGISPGSVTITLSCGAVVKKVELTVKITAKRIEVDKACIMLKPGESYQLHASVMPKDATDRKLIYSSENKDVATVDWRGLITASSYGSTTVIIKNEDTFAAVSVIVNGNAMKADDIVGGEPDTDTYVLKENMFSYECPVITSDMLRYLYNNKKDLQINADDYMLIVRGKCINNLNNELETNIKLSKTSQNISFSINEQDDLCGTVTVCIKEAETYKYLYLYNETTEKYHLIQTESLGRIDITTPGSYVLTNTVYSSLRISWWWIAISAVLIFVLLVAYVCVKKRHWFW